jgi:hypothetical protein
MLANLGRQETDRMFRKSSKEYENGNGNACYPVCKDGLQRPVIAKNNQKAFPKRPPNRGCHKAQVPKAVVKEISED